MREVILVALGGGVGAALRYGVVGAAAKASGAAGWPVGTLAVNALGGLALGLLVGLLGPAGEANADGPAQDIRVLLGVGLLGGFTTFSAYALEVVHLMEKKHHIAAMGYAFGSVLAAVAAVMAGLIIARWLTP